MGCPLVLIQLHSINLFWILLCQTSTLILELSKLFMILKVFWLHRKPVTVILASVRNDQKFQLQFYPKIFWENGAFLPEYSIQHQMHFHQVFVLISLFTVTPHSLHKSSASEMAVAEKSFFQLLIRSVKVPTWLDAWWKVVSSAWRHFWIQSIEEEKKNFWPKQQGCKYRLFTTIEI